MAQGHFVAEEFGGPAGGKKSHVHERMARAPGLGAYTNEKGHLFTDRDDDENPSGGVDFLQLVFLDLSCAAFGQGFRKEDLLGDLVTCQTLSEKSLNLFCSGHAGLPSFA